MIYTVYCPACERERDLVLPLAEHGNWPNCCGRQMRQAIKPKEIVPDIEPYRTVAADERTGKRENIGGRRAHREFLKRNRLVEIGNEMPKPRKPEYDPGPREKMRADIRQAIREVRSR